MSFTRILGLCGLLTVVSVTASFAQERAAASALGTQMTWSALADQVKAASNRVTVLDGQMQKTIICNKRFMAYAPGAAGADGDGCIENQLIKQLSKRVDDLALVVEGINTRLTTVEGKVVKIEGDIASLTTKMTDLTKRVDIAEQDISKLDTRLKTVEGKIAALDSALKTEIADRKAGDKELAADIAAEVTARKAGDTTLNTRITTEVKAINADIAALEKSVATLTTKVKDNSDDINAIGKCGAKSMVWNGTTGKCVATASDSRWYQSDAFTMGGLQNMTAADPFADLFKQNLSGYGSRYSKVIQLQDKYASVPACKGGIVPNGRICTPNTACHIETVDRVTNSSQSDQDRTTVTRYVSIFECN